MTRLGWICVGVVLALLVAAWMNAEPARPVDSGWRESLDVDYV